VTDAERLTDLLRSRWPWTSNRGDVDVWIPADELGAAVAAILDLLAAKAD
jgi:hypothetical protein